MKGRWFQSESRGGGSRRRHRDITRWALDTSSKFKSNILSVVKMFSKVLYILLFFLDSCLKKQTNWIWFKWASMESICNDWMGGAELALKVLIWPKSSQRRSALLVTSEPKHQFLLWMKMTFFSQLLTENCCTSGICHTLQQQKLFSDAKMNIRGLKVCLSWLQLHVGSPKGAYLSFPQILRTAPISSSSFPTETDGCPCDFCSWSSSLEIKQTRLFYTLKLMFSWELTQLGLFSL